MIDHLRNLANGWESTPIHLRYEAFVHLTNIQPYDPVLPGLGELLELQAELGEVTEIYQKLRRNGRYLEAADKKKLKDELGDVLWAFQALCKVHHFSLESLMQENMEKLCARLAEKES